MKSFIVGGIRVKEGDTVQFWYSGGSHHGTRRVIVKECDEGHLYGEDTSDNNVPKCYLKSKMGTIKIVKPTSTFEEDRKAVEELFKRFPSTINNYATEFNKKYGVNYRCLNGVFGPQKQTTFIGNAIINTNVLRVDINGHKFALDNDGYLLIDGSSVYTPLLAGFITKLKS